MKLLYGGYGHNPDPSGKQYAYWGGDNYNVGQNVVAPVTNHGKTYNTMFTIQATYDTDKDLGKYMLGQLKGIDLKTIGSKDVMQLPGASQYSTKSQWTIASKNQARARLRAMNTSVDTTQAKQQLLSRGI
jgi:hypothetical protein